MRMLSRGMMVKLRLPAGWSGVQGGIAYAAAVLEAKKQLWLDGGSEVPLVREALQRGLPESLVTPKTHCYAWNLDMLARRLMLPHRQIEDVAKTLTVYRDYACANFAVNVIKMYHPDYYQTAVLMETGEVGHNWNQPHAQVNAGGKPGPLFDTKQALSRLSTGVKVSMALVAATYTHKLSDKMYAETVLANMMSQVAVTRGNAPNAMFHVDLRVPCDLSEPGGADESELNPPVHVTDAGTLRYVYLRLKRAERYFQRAAMPNWLRPQSESAWQYWLNRVSDEALGAPLGGLF